MSILAVGGQSVRSWILTVVFTKELSRQGCTMEPAQQICFSVLKLLHFFVSSGTVYSQKVFLGGFPFSIDNSILFTGCIQQDLDYMGSQI